MKAIYFATCLFFLSADAVLNQPTQEAQRREAPAQDYGAPPAQQYGAPKLPPQMAVRQHRIHAMQRLIAAMRNGGYAANQGRVVNRPRPIPLSPQNSYGPPKNSYGPPPSSGSGSLASFMTSHNPDVKCDGWIPIPGPAHESGGGSAGHAHSIDSSYGPPRHGSGNSGLNTQVIVVPDNSYGPPPQDSYGPPSGHSESSGHSHSHNSGSAGHSIDIQDSYGPPAQVQPPHDSYGPPNHSSGSAGHSIDIQPPHDSYGPPNHGSGSAGHAVNVQDSYGPPTQQPHDSYGPPSGHSDAGHSHSSNSASSGHSINVQDSYGPPASSGHGSAGHAIEIQESYGPPAPVQQPHDSYGPPSHGGGSSGHAISVQETYGPPAPVPIPQDSYGPPSGHSGHSESSGHSHSSVGSGSSFDSGYQGQQVGHSVYGPPEVQPKAPVNSYGPPPSGNSHSESHHHSSQGHASESHFSQGHSGSGDIQTIHSLPEINSGQHFDNAIGLVTSSLGVSAGQNEVIPSHAIHESHTSELTNNFNGGDSYTAPPLDSYAPGKYAPSFMKLRPQGPSQNYAPQRPQPRPQYIPPIPMKLLRPQGPQQNFRPQFNSHAQSIAQGYSSGHSQQSGHAQHSIHSPNQVRQQPRHPLPHRAPVPQGLFQSIGQHVEALDNSQHGHGQQNIGNTYLPPAAHELPIPPMRLSVPNHLPAQPFLSQHQSHGSGSASSSSAFSYQNQQLQNVHIIHDCAKNHQLAQGYGAPQAPQLPADGYGTPLGQPLESYQSPFASQLSGLSGNYEIPNGALEVPQHNSIDFNSPSNSYGPPASGPASLDVVGLESRQRVNTVVSAESEHQNIVAAASEVSNEALPGLSDGLNGLNFISAQKSHSIEVPSQGGQVGAYQLQFTTSQSDQNRIEAPNHQQILADGLLQSILTAIDKNPSQTVPQVAEDPETDHSEVKVFLKSPRGQEVLADKQATA